MFHANNNLYFKRLEDGSVSVVKAVPALFYPACDKNCLVIMEQWTIPASEWASVVAAVSSVGETSMTYKEALSLHTGEPAK